jgi:hypothetical protein
MPTPNLNATDAQAVVSSEQAAVASSAVLSQMFKDPAVSDATQAAQSVKPIEDVKAPEGLTGDVVTPRGL